MTGAHDKKASNKEAIPKVTTFHGLEVQPEGYRPSFLVKEVVKNWHDIYFWLFMRTKNVRAQVAEGQK